MSDDHEPTITEGQYHESIEIGDAQAVIDLALAATITEAAPLPGADRRIVTQLIPPGYKLAATDLEKFAAHPDRAKCTYSVNDTASFCTLLRRHQDEQTVVYVQPDNFAAVAVLDDHGVDRPGWRQHRIHLAWKPTPGWQRWSKASHQMLDQTVFANLVEEGITEIASPAGADLLELAQSIRATTSAEFRSDRRLNNGQVQLTYHESIDASAGRNGDMTIPDKIVLLIAPFYGAEPQQLNARLRYSVSGGKLKLGVFLDRRDEVLLEAVAAEVAKIESESGLAPVVYGTPGN